MTELIHGDCLEVLRSMPDCSVDAVVTDPPYGLSFMDKKWDYDVPGVEVWAECLRVLKPGGHLLAFAGTRTQHRMAVRIEDAGFEIRDMIAWVYGAGFPKSLDVSKAIDKAAGAEREVVGRRYDGVRNTESSIHKAEGFAASRTQEFSITSPATDAAKQWQGWGTALKPALEPITVARKPLIGTVAENVLQHGTGAINVDGGRVGTHKDVPGSPNGKGITSGYSGGWGDRKEYMSGFNPNIGRWPANFIHDGSEEATDLLKDSARFFYCAKASKADRDAGCEELEARRKVFNGQSGHSAGMAPGSVEDKFTTTPSANFHPTVKPTDLMRYLCRLVTPPNGVVLDPFMGSGSTGKAAALEGFNFIGIEREAEYVAIAQARINHVSND